MNLQGLESWTESMFASATKRFTNMQFDIEQLKSRVTDLEYRDVEEAAAIEDGYMRLETIKPDGELGIDVKQMLIKNTRLTDELAKAKRAQERAENALQDAHARRVRILNLQLENEKLKQELANAGAIISESQLMCNRDDLLMEIRGMEQEAEEAKAAMLTKGREAFVAGVEWFVLTFGPMAVGDYWASIALAEAYKRWPEKAVTQAKTLQARLAELEPKG